MSLPYRVALKGFSAFERSALSSYFRLAANRTPSYEQVDAADDAFFLVVDADHAEAVQSVLADGRLADTVFIGAAPPAGASAWMMRPIDPLHVLRELDALVARRLAAGRAASSAAAAASGRTISLLKARDPGPVPLRRASDAAPPAAASRPAALRRGRLALVVDDLPSRLPLLLPQLQRLGLQAECVSGSAKAIELLAHRRFDFIFCSLELGAGSDLDGLALCQHIKRQHRHVGGGPAPVVIMVAAQHSELDRVRGTLAGADAHLAGPLDDAALARLLADHGAAPAAEAGAPAL